MRRPGWLLALAIFASALSSAASALDFGLDRVFGNQGQAQRAPESTAPRDPGRPVVPPVQSRGKISGTVRVLAADQIRVGDTIVVLWGLRGLEVRQPCRTTAGVEFACGERAAREFANRFDGQQAFCAVVARDQSASLGWCWTEGRNEADLGAWAVASGFAFDCRSESGGYYGKNEEFARSNRRGAWSTAAFELPWQYRREGNGCGR